MPVSVVLADDHVLVRQALKSLLEREGIRVVGETSDGQEVISLVETLMPDVAIIDISMPILNGIDAARELKRLLPSVALIMYSAFGDILPKQEARRAGVSEVVSKSESGVTLVSTARRLLFPDAA